MGGFRFTFVVLQEHQSLGLRCCRKEGTGVATVDFISISQKPLTAFADLFNVSIILRQTLHTHVLTGSCCERRCWSLGVFVYLSDSWCQI